MSLETHDPLGGAGGASGAPPKIQAPALGALPPGLTLPRPGPGGGFASRFGGPVALTMAIQQALAGGAGSIAVPLGAIGQVPGLLTQEQWGRYLQAGGQTPSEPGAAAGGFPRAARGPTGGCRLQEPEFSLSGDVQQRVDDYERELRETTAPLGAEGVYPQETWNELWTLTFRTEDGIQLARQLLWLVRGIKRGRVGSADTVVRYEGRRVDLKDPSFQPRSVDFIQDERPLLGEPLYGFYAQTSPIVVGSPFGIEETYRAIRRLARTLEAKKPNCQPAHNLNGDAYVALRYLAKWLRLRGRPRVQAGSRSYDVVALHLRAQGAGAEEFSRLAPGGEPLRSGEVVTTQDLRIARQRSQSPTGLRLGVEHPRAGEPAFEERAERVFVQRESVAESSQGRAFEVDEERWRPFQAATDQGAVEPPDGRRFPADHVDDTGPVDWWDPMWDLVIPGDFDPEVKVPKELTYERTELPGGGVGVEVNPDSRAAQQYQDEIRRALWHEELARRRAGQEADKLRSGFEVTPYVSTVPSGVRLAESEPPQARAKADPGCDCDR